MRALPAAVLLLVMVAVSPANAAGACSGRTVAAGERYRIVEDDHLYLACLRSGGPGVELVGVYSDEDLVSFKVAGRYIAFEVGSNTSSGYSDWLELGDMKTGRLESVDDAVFRYVVRATGSVAWAASDPSRVDGPPQINLMRMGVRGQRTLAEGPGVDPSSLQRVSRRAVWLENGKRRSALMP